MYEKTYDGIMADMMDGFGVDVRTDEGSLAFNACAKQAEKLEDVYAEMDEIRKNMSPLTMDLPHLIDFSKERGLKYSYAKAVVVKAKFSQEIEIGSKFVCGDYTYTVDSALDEEYTYKLICDEDGAEPNTVKGAVTPSSFVENWKGGTITEILAPGENDEGIEIFREKVLKSFENMGFGGNKADYKNFINSLDGVGGCKPKRRDQDSAWINAHIIASDYSVPSSELVTKVQTAVDPEQSHGEGDGMAPCCHNVKIKAVEGVAINVSATVTFDSGYSVSTSKTAIEGAISKYLLELRKAWEDNGFKDTIVRLAQIEARIITVEGVLDVTNTRLNGTDGNITLNYEQIPIAGEVTINV